MAVLNPGPLVGSIPSEGASLHAVGRYGSLGDAEEDGLAILAMGEAYWTFRDGDYFILCVEPSAVTAVEEELRASRKLRRRRFPWQKGSDDLEVQSFGVTSFLVVGALIVVFFLLQFETSILLTKAGRADSIALIENGEWWRPITALTLHGGLPHLVANLAAGLGFGFWLARYLGVGWTWTLLLLSGTLGNLMTAVIYYPEPHLSLGASTAVFGALGLITGFGFVHSGKSANKRLFLPEWIIPPIAGLTLLGLLGAGGGKTDVIAHLCGFACGFAIAIPFSFLPSRLYRKPIGFCVGLLSFILLGVAWATALF